MAPPFCRADATRRALGRPPDARKNRKEIVAGAIPYSIATAYIDDVPPVTGVSHLGLTVRNLATSELWYERLFGLQRVHYERGPREESAVLQDPDSEMVISLRHHFYAGGARFDETRTGLDHVSFGVADRSALDEWEQRLEDLGIEHSEILETEFGWLLVFRDPDFIQLELFCRRRPLLKVAEAPTASEMGADNEVEEPASESPPPLVKVPHAPAAASADEPAVAAAADGAA
jgi:glyoxylase I family protein